IIAGLVYYFYDTGIYGDMSKRMGEKPTVTTYSSTSVQPITTTTTTPTAATRETTTTSMKTIVVTTIAENTPTTGTVLYTSSMLEGSMTIKDGPYATYLPELSVLDSKRTMEIKR
ncbi:unnamed protein product, partial [Owenia fusiformis]